MKKAILTGHSKGLGAGFVRALTGAGFQVLGLSRSASGLDNEGLREIAVDLADPAAVAALVAGDALSGFLDGAGTALLINNAGIVDPIAPAGRQDAAAIARAVSLNIAAPLIFTNAFVALTDGIADRRIMHISSGAARSAYTGWSVYCATKAALDHHARAVEQDAVAGLKIESTAPGVIDTDMQVTIRNTPEEDFRLRERFQGMKDSGSLASADEAAGQLVTHLLSDRFGAEVCTDIRRL